MTGTSLVALKTFKHNGGRLRKGLQTDVISVRCSLADRFAQAGICTAIIGNTARRSSVTRTGMLPSDYRPATVAA
jgi:hypothetical protein